MRRVLTAVLACAAAVLAGCGAPPPPEVTFFADGDTVRARPQLLCEIGAEECLQDEAAEVSLRIRPGRPVQVSVPAEVSDGLWGVVFSYVDRDGNRVDASSRVFTPGSKQLAYTLELPADSDRLLLAAVQQLVTVDGDQLLVSGIWKLRGED